MAQLKNNTTIGGNTFTVGNSFYAVANGNVGVGDSAPNTSLTVNGSISVSSGIRANGSFGSAGQVLTSNGTTVYWSTVSGGGGGSVNVDSQYVWTNTHTFNQTINGTANNALFLGGNSASDLIAYSSAAYSNAVSYVDGKSYVNTSQLSSNLAGYQTTAGLAANVATLAANSSTYANASISNTFTVGNSVYFVANGNVGVGITAPTAKFTVANGTSASVSHFYGTYTDASNYERVAIGSNSTTATITQEFAGTGTWKDFVITGGGNTKALKLFSPSNGKIILETSGNQGIEINPDASMSVNKRVAPGNTYTSIAAFNANSVGGLSVSAKVDSSTNHSLRLNSSGSYIKQFEIGAGTQAGGQVGTDVYMYSGIPGSNTLRAGNFYIYAAESGGSGAPGNLILQSNGTTNYAGNVGIGTTTPSYKLQVNGSFAATTKSFVIDHQSKPNHKLRYGSLEGPENGVYERGKTQSNIIELPEYWTWLVDEETITVSLTPIGKSQQLCVDRIEDNKVYIKGKNINCFYHVFGERKDVDKLEVEIST
jgi:hypothetical protein